MNFDTNVQKVLFSLLRRWKLIIIFAIVGALAGYFYTANFTTLTYTSEVKFLAYAVDSKDELSSSYSTSTEVARTSNTSKMNYAIKMIPTYIEIMRTNKFCQQLVDDMNESYNSNYSTSSVSGSYDIVPISDTAMFKITVTTTDADLSYNIAKQLEKTVPKMMKNANQGLVLASVQDNAIKAASAGNPGYVQKTVIGAAVGIILSAAYVILRTLLDVRIKSSDELTEKYNIPVLGSIPNFESRILQTTVKEVNKYVTEK